MTIQNGLFTSEAVSSGHPDKLCDRISDAILDAFLARDPQARVACETLAADQRIIVSGEFRTRDPAHFEEVKARAPALIRQLLRDTGYDSAELDIDPDSCAIELLFNHQSPQIAAAVDQHDQTLGAGDQGLMFGYACDETPELMPLAWSLATDLVARATSLVHSKDKLLRADGKSQVTVRYEEGRPIGVQCVVLSWQHQPDVPLEHIRQYLTEKVIDTVIPRALRTTDFLALVNAAGAWTIGGPKGDTGLTGRKIIVDTYGGACPHGGGAFSGKDPSKVDRSGAYAARQVAKSLVTAGLARRCTVQLAYAIGYPEPVSIHVNSHGTGTQTDEQLAALVAREFDLSPAGIIRDLHLERPIYGATAALGHFGKYRAASPWEQVRQLPGDTETASYAPNDPPRCPYCRSNEDCEHLLLVVDNTFMQVEAGLLFAAFKDCFYAWLEQADDDADQSAYFAGLLEHVESLADASDEYEQEGWPGMSSDYSYFYAATKGNAEAALAAFSRLEL